MKFYYFYTLKELWDSRVKLRCIMGCPGLKSSYRGKGLLSIFPVIFMAAKTIKLIILPIIQSSEKMKFRPEPKCDYWQIIRIAWEDLYKRKTNWKSDNQMTKKILKKSTK